MDIKETIKQRKPFESEFQKAYINFIFTAKQMENRNMAIMKPFKITGQHYNVLRILKGRYPETASPGEIKEVLLDKKCDLTRLIDKLVKADYVERDLNIENRRKVDIKITEGGLAFLDEIDPVVKEMNHFHKVLTVEEAEQLNTLLDKIRS